MGIQCIKSVLENKFPKTHSQLKFLNMSSIHRQKNLITKYCIQVFCIHILSVVLATVNPTNCSEKALKRSVSNRTHFNYLCKIYKRSKEKSSLEKVTFETIQKISDNIFKRLKLDLLFQTSKLSYELLPW